MTLALTEVSPLGIAMAADSALTFNGKRSFSGAQKLIPASEIDAGLSIWGDFKVGDQYADEWLQGFVSTHIRSGLRLWDVAQSLAQELNQSSGVRGWMGIHVAGYDTKDGIRAPAFYHVLNGHHHVECQDGNVLWVPDEDPPIREFRAECDRSPEAMINSPMPYITRNGDIADYVFLSEALPGIFRNIESQTSLQFPYPATLYTRGEYLRFCIQMVADVYRLSNRRNLSLTQAPTVGETHVGGPITVLTISERGIQDFYTK